MQIGNRKYHIVLAPIGPFEEDLLQCLMQGISQIFGLRVTVEILLQDIEFAYHPGRMQYHSTAILTRLAEILPENQLRVLALTSLDLFIPILTHVYGEAQLGGRAGIVSVHRLQDGLEDACDRAHYRRRVLKEAGHELGHTFFLKHCPDAKCIMHYCRSLRDVDQKQDRFCRYCRVMLDDALQDWLA